MAIQEYDVIVRFDSKGVAKTLGHVNALEHNLAQVESRLASRGLIQQHQAQMHRLGMAYLNPAKNITHFARNMSNLSRSFTESTASGIPMVKNMTEANKVISNLGRGAKTVEPIFRKQFSTWQRGRIMMDSFGKGVRSLTTQWQRMAKNAQWTGRQMMVGLSLPLAAVGTIAVRTFTSVEAEYTRMLKVMSSPEAAKSIGLVAGQFDEMQGSVNKIVSVGRGLEVNAGNIRSAIRDLSTEYAINQELVVGVAADWAAMGYEGEKLVPIIDEVFRAASLGDIDVSVATEQFRSTLAIFGQTLLEDKRYAGQFGDAIEATHFIMNQFNAIENATALQMRELAEAFPEVANSASVFGLTAAETASAMAGMKNQGVPANEAAHALKFGLQRLHDPTGKVKDQIKEIAKVLPDTASKLMQITEGSLKGQDALTAYALAVQQVNDQMGAVEAEKLVGGTVQRRQANRWIALNREIQTGILEYLSGVREADAATSQWLKAMLATGEMGERSIDRIIADLDEAAQREISLRLEDPQADFQRFQVVLKQFLYDVGQELWPQIEKGMAILRDWLESFRNLDPAVKNLITRFAILLAAIGPVVYITAQLGLAFSTVLHGIGKLIPEMGFITKDILLAHHATELLDGRVGQIGDKFFLLDTRLKRGIMRLKNWIRGVDSATASTEAWNAATTTQNTLVATRRPGSPVAGLGKAKTAAPAAPEPAIAPVPAPGFFQSIKNMLSKLPLVGRLFKTNITQASADAANAVSKASSSMKVDANAMARVLGTNVAGGADEAVASISKFGETVAKTSGRFAKFAGTAAIITVVITLIIGLVENVIKYWDKFSAGVGEATERLVKPFKAAWKSLVDGAKAVWRALDKLFDAVNNIISGLIEPLGGLSSGTDEAGSSWQVLGQIIVRTAEGIGYVLHAMAEITEVTMKIIAFAIEEVIKILNLLKPIFKAIGHVFADVVGIIASLIKGDFANALAHAVNLIVDFFVAPIVKGIELMVDMVATSAEVIIDILSKIAEAGSHLPGFLGGGAFETAKNALDDASDAIGDFVDRDWTGELRDVITLDTKPVFDEQDAQDTKEDAERKLSPLEPILNPNVEKMDEEELEEFAQEQADERADKLREWLGALKSSLDDVVNEIKDSAMAALEWAQNARMQALEKSHESILNALELSHAKQLAVYDEQIEKIEEREEAEKRWTEYMEYMANRRRMIQEFELNRENYRRNRAKAIYEGRIDDAREMDRQFQYDSQEHKQSLAELDADRNQQLLDQQREAERKRIEEHRSYLETLQSLETAQTQNRLETQKTFWDFMNALQKDGLEKSLALLTEYTPKNQEEMQKMVDGISGVLAEAGVDWKVTYGSAVGAWQEATRDAQKDLEEEAYWSAKGAAEAFKEQIISGQQDPYADKTYSRAQALKFYDVWKSKQWPGAVLGKDELDAYGDWLHNFNLFLGLLKAQQAGAAVNALVSGGGVNAFHAGGLIGQGSPKDVPAVLQSGEYVMSRKAVEALGPEFLGELNKTRKYHDGGYVDAIRSGFSRIFQNAVAMFSMGLGTIGGLSKDDVMAKLQGQMGGVGAILPLLQGQYIISGLQQYLAQVFPQWAGSILGAGTYRSEAYNESIGGAENSWHIYGKAMDISGPADMMEAIFQHLAANISKYAVIELIHRDRFFDWPTGWRRGGGHFDHVHVAVARNVFTGAPGAIAGESPQAKVRALMPWYGWGEGQWGPLNALIQGESGWNPRAQNRKSRAFGLFQFMPMHWVPGGYLPKGPFSSVDEQVRAGLRYIRDRYGTPANAYGKWLSRSPHWYHGGGVAKMLGGGMVPYDDFPAILHRKEMVIPRPMTEALENVAGTGGGGETFIYVDTFVGEEKWFKEMMDRYNIKEMPRKYRNRGTINRKVGSRKDNLVRYNG